MKAQRASGLTPGHTAARGGAPTACSLSDPCLGSDCCPGTEQLLAAQLGPVLFQWCVLGPQNSPTGGTSIISTAARRLRLREFAWLAQSYAEDLTLSLLRPERLHPELHCAPCLVAIGHHLHTLWEALFFPPPSPSGPGILENKALQWLQLFKLLGEMRTLPLSSSAPLSWGSQYLPGSRQV